MKRILPILLILLLIPFFGVQADESNKIIQQGDKGEEIVRIQTRLFDLGYYSYKPTGSYRTVTRTAVVDYQAASGLMSDGSVGAETMDALFSRGAKRVEFHAYVPLSFSAQGSIAQRGNPIVWKDVQPKLKAGESYRIKNAATGEEAILLFVSGESHAEMDLPLQIQDRTAALTMLTNWLGNSNSFYKCAILFDLDGQWVSASIQWNGVSHACIYFSGSLSHVLNLPDLEHEVNIRKVS